MDRRRHGLEASVRHPNGLTAAARADLPRQVELARRRLDRLQRDLAAAGEGAAAVRVRLAADLVVEAAGELAPRVSATGVRLVARSADAVRAARAGATGG